MFAGWGQDVIKLENKVKYLFCVLYLLKWQQYEINCSELCFLAQQIWFNLFPADISKVMQAKKKRLECLTKNYMKGSQHKLEQLWNNYHAQRWDFILSLTEGKSATTLNCHMSISCVFVVFTGRRSLTSTPSRFPLRYSSGRLKPSELRSRKRSSMLVHLFTFG